MKHQKNNIPSVFPIPSEAGHERPIRPVRPVRRCDARKQGSWLPPQPMIKIVQLPSCNHCHWRVPSKGNAQAGACYEHHALPPSLPPSHERQIRTRGTHNAVYGTHKSVVPTSTPPQIPMKAIPSIHTRSALHQASTPRTQALHMRQRGIKMQREIREIPSSSTLSSSNPSPSVKRRHRATPTKTKGEPAPSQRGMSERAAETIRIMEWVKERVKAAEKSAREHERGLHEQKEFLLQLRIWEAEMKFRNLMQDVEGDEPEDEEHEVECLDPSVFWIGNQSRMGRLGMLVRDSRRRSLRGLAIVLSR